ncbi:MAG: elongation factor, partial [Actinomycetota bacterium]|nr:elongation factor [Actinomycetota bacterium]
MGARTAGETARRARSPRAGDLAPDDPAGVRSVAVVGPMTAGKTTLVEELLAAAGVIPRAGSVAAGSTVTDHDAEARRQQRSVSLAVASLTHRGTKVNLIDTPGCPDFLAEVRAGLRAADAVLFVLGTADVAEGAAAPTSALLAECRRAGLPAMLVLSRLDHARADEEAALVACRAAVAAADAGEVLVPVTRTDRAADGTLTVHPLLGADGADPGPEDPDDARRALVETLIEQSEDEALLETWISGEPVPLAALRADLAAAVARRSVVPVVGVCAPAGAGLDALLDLVVDAVPPPTAHPPLAAHAPDGAAHAPVALAPDGPVVAEVVHTGTDAQGSRVSLVRVFSGRLAAESMLTVCGDPLRVPSPRDGGDPTAARAAGSARDSLRVARVYAPLGATLREVPWCVAGDLCALTRLGVVGTGDTLCGVEDP